MNKNNQHATVITELETKRMSAEARKPLLERNITRNRPDVSLAAFAFLFSEMVQNAHARVSRVDDLEAR